MFTNILAEFQKSTKLIQLVHRKPREVVLGHAKSLYVLDSSFNPPHLGHLALVNYALKYDFKEKILRNSITNHENKEVILMLSVNNADKPEVPEPFEVRLEMMAKMADFIANKFDVAVSICLTKNAKFVDKRKSLAEIYQSDTNHPGPGFIFLVGMDTLIRILDWKYYSPLTISEALGSFFNNSSLFCLLRDDSKTTFLEQKNYVKSIAEGKIPNVPSSWSNKISLLPEIAPLDESIISSSYIRRDILKNGLKWKEYVIPSIKDYIIQNYLYVLDKHD